MQKRHYLWRLTKGAAGIDHHLFCGLSSSVVCASDCVTFLGPSAQEVTWHAKLQRDDTAFC